MSESEYNNVQAIIENGVANIRVHKLDNSEFPFVVVPDKCRVESLKPLADERPSRIRKKVIVADVASFGLYFHRFSTDDTVIFCSEDSRQVRAVFDYHGKDKPDWCDHELVMVLAFTDEWETWIGKNGRKMDQTEFAEFIEDNLPDIVEPSGVDMLDIAKTIEATKDLRFSSGVRLDNGQHQLVFNEEINGTACNGRLEIPQEFKIGVRVFKGDEGYKVTARFRWRIKRESKQLELWYDLVRPHKIVDDAYTGALERLIEMVGGNLIKQA